MRYEFKEVTHCEMCGAATSQHKILGQRRNSHQGAFPRRKGGVTVAVKKCRNCGLVFADPQPIPVNIQDHYGVPPESYWKPAYFDVAPDYFGLVLDRYRKLCPEPEGNRALDIGAGIGKAMVAMTRAGLEAWGIEPSNAFRDRAIEKLGIAPERLQLAAIEQAQFELGSFDFITFGAVLEHLYEPGTSIKKALQWLKGGGVIHIEVPSSKWLIGRMFNMFYAMQGSDYVTNISPMHVPYHLYEFDLRSFERNAKINGYEVAFHEYYVCDTYLPKALDWILKPWMRLTGSGMQLSIWLRKKR